jgi:hypothetical protein
MMQAELPGNVAIFNEAFDLPDAGCKVVMLKKSGSCIEVFECLADDVDTASERRPVCSIRYGPPKSGGGSQAAHCGG